MKLNEYIFKEYTKGASALTPDDIERWIVEWDMTEFTKVGCDGELDDKYEGETARLPPVWLANWRKHIELD